MSAITGYVSRVKAVITGANGFIGRQLTALFAERGYDVRPIVRADFANGKLERDVESADVIVHAAAMTRAPTRSQLREANVELTRRVLATATASRVKRFVLISSQAAAGPAASLSTPTREDDAPAPVEAYGESKRDAEELVRKSELSYTIVRPSAIYGPGDKDFRAMFALAHRGLAIHAGNRSQWISIIHVRDCVEGVFAAATSPAAIGQTYFLANDEPVQWSSLFDFARDAAGGRRIADVEMPLPLVRLGAAFGDVAARLTGRAGLLTSEKVALSAAPFWVCSNEKAKRELGVVPRIALREGIAETYRWYLENGGL